MRENEKVRNEISTGKGKKKDLKSNKLKDSVKLSYCKYVRTQMLIPE